MTASSPHREWTSRFTFLMASVGFAVGLGNIWKFPYEVGENGGALFVVIYLVCALVIAIPVLTAEIMIGRYGRMSPANAMLAVARATGASPRWRWLGGMTMLAALLLLLVFSVVGGWVLEYLYFALAGKFDGMSGDDAKALFSSVVGSPIDMFAWTGLSLGLTAMIVGSGIRKGIGRAVSILMPLLFLLIIALAVYGIFAADFPAAARFLFSPDVSKLDMGIIPLAMGQAFLSIGVAMAGMMTYGAYLPRSASIGRSAVIVVLADTGVALLAGLAIFPLVFQYGLHPGSGAGLIFETLPLAFAQMPGGYLIGIAFFVLLTSGALTSLIGLLEPVVSWAEEHKGFSRAVSSSVIAIVMWLLTSISILSHHRLADWSPLDFFPRFAGMNFNDLIGFVTEQVMLPLGGILIAVFAGWVINKRDSSSELAIANSSLYSLWRFLVRYVVPVAIFVVLVIGVF